MKLHFLHARVHTENYSNFSTVWFNGMFFLTWLDFRLLVGNHAAITEKFMVLFVKKSNADCVIVCYWKYIFVDMKDQG